MAASTLLSDLIARVTRLSGQVPGTSVQQYSEDVITDFINSSIRHIAHKYWWPELMEWTTTALDGTTGVVTADLSGIVDDFKNIRAIFFRDFPRPVPMMSRRINPTLYTTGGDIALGWEALPVSDAQYTSKLFRMIPPTSTGAINLHTRRIPALLRLPSDVTYFDRDLVAYGALWQALEDEAAIPQQASRYKMLFDATYNRLIDNIGDQPISANANLPPWPGLWTELP